MELRIVDNNSEWLDKVIALGDSCRATVGFMPKQAFVDYAYRREILALTTGDALVAYVMYRYRDYSLVIVHMCVSEKYRKHGYAEKLMDALYEQEKAMLHSSNYIAAETMGSKTFGATLAMFQYLKKLDEHINHRQH